MPLNTLRIAARLEYLPEAVAFVEENADRFCLTSDKKFASTLAFEEAFVNICHHAYPNQEGMAELSCSMEDGLFIVEISDTGVAFDLLSLPDPDLSSDLMERKIGGLGVYFIRTLSDKVSYRRHEGHNVLRMCFGRA